jgi:hypothetical protein
MKVHECKELTDLLSCIQNGVYYDNSLWEEACGGTETEGAFGGNTYGNRTVYLDSEWTGANAIDSSDKCAAKCTEQRDYCQWYTYDDQHPTSKCILYSGTCASGVTGTTATSA